MTQELPTDLHIYRGRVYKALGPNDDRLQIRIIPQMLRIPANEETNLPRFPMLEKGTFCATYTESDDGPEKASEVIVLCNDEFTVGYVLCEANRFETNSPQKFTGSYNWRAFKRYLEQRHCCPADFEYKDVRILVNSIDSDRGSGVVIGYHIYHGDYFIMNASGSLFTVQQDKVFIRAGSPSASGQEFSAITVTPSKIELKTNLLSFDAKNIVLGHDGGLVLCGTNAMSPMAVDGMSIVPIKHVSV